MSELEDARAEFLQLRDGCRSVQLATVNGEACPEASYAPCVYHDKHFYLFLSGLSSHTGNLLRDPRIGLLLLDETTPDRANLFARKRASLGGRAEVIARQDPMFASVIGEFHRSFGKVMELLEPLPDFQLFRISIVGGSYVRGFGQAYTVGGDEMDQLNHVDPRQ